MGRRPETPRLGTIDAEALAQEVLRLVERRVSELAAFLDVGVERRRASAKEAHRAMVTLAEWAQHGGEDRRAAGIAALDTIERAVFLRAIDPSAELGLTACTRCNASLLDPETALGVVIAAAHARVALGVRRPVTAVELAALGGVNASRIRQLMRAGDLERDASNVIPARSAREWLAQRAVPGFERQAARA